MRISCTSEHHAQGGPGCFFLARAEDVLDQLIKEYAGKVQLIYLDPPFGTGDTFHVRLSGERKSINLPVFEDKLNYAEYLIWMEQILTGCHKLLSPSGSIYLHIDYRKSAELRLLLNRIFGEKNFMNEIIWSYKTGGRSTRYFPRKHDTILFYRKSGSVYFDIKAVGKPRGPEKRNHMKRFVDEDGRICFSIRSGGKTYYYYEDTPVYPTDVWTDIEHLQQKDKERTGYATQKPEALLRRIISASSRPGDLVMDLFSGSGTTASVSAKLGRRFLASDASPFALNILRSRLIKNSGTKSLMEDALPPEPMTLYYPEDNTPAGIEYDMSAGKDSTTVRLKRAEFDGVYPLAYAALGRSKDGCFYPAAVSFSPKLPLRISAKVEGTPVIHIADAVGRQAFFTLV